MRILFVSREASRTGAPIAILNLLRWFRSNADFDFDVLLQEGGPMQGDFAAVAQTTVFNDGKVLTPTYRERALHKAGLVGFVEGAARRARRRLRTFSGYDIVYGNGINSELCLRHLPPPTSGILMHVHELEYAMSLLAPESRAFVIGAPRHFIAASNAVRDNLVQRHSVGAVKVDVCYESIDVSQLQRLDKSHLRGATRAELGIPDDAFVVGSSGSLTWRKGPDLFTFVAAQLLSRPELLPEVHFVWVGGGPDGLELMHEVTNSGIAARFHLVPETDRPHHYFAAFDLFVSTAREDPFPLVCLEAAALGLPIVCFDSGGMKEFVRNDAGRVVRYPLVARMADVVAELLMDEPLRRDLGEAARVRVCEENDTSVVGPEVLRVIERIVAGRSSIA